MVEQSAKFFVRPSFTVTTQLASPPPQSDSVSPIPFFSQSQDASSSNSSADFHEQSSSSSPSSSSSASLSQGYSRGTDDIRTLLDLVGFNAVNNPDHLFCLQEVKDAPSLRKITFRELLRAVELCSAWLCRAQCTRPADQLPGWQDNKPAAVALVMGSDIGIFIYLLALMRLGTPVALFSARLSAAAIAHLLKKTSITQVLVTSHTTRAANEAAGMIFAESEVEVTCTAAPSFDRFFEDTGPILLQSEEAKEVPPQFDLIKDADRNVIILHSSGSTGLPKPIYQTHRYLLGYAACHAFPEDTDVSHVCASTLPLFHGFGLLAPGLALSIGKPFALPSSSTIPNAKSTICLIKNSFATSLMTVPMVLEDLCLYPEEEGIRAMVGLDFVACGGGPMKPSVAEILDVKGVKLLNHCGATEIGAMAPIFNPGPDYDYHYFVLRRDLALRTEKAEDRDGDVKLVARPPGWDEDYTVQDFLKPNPDSPTSQFKFLGRADDLIVLANGEKVRPTSLEDTVSNDSRIKGAIVFGESRDHLGIIVEAAAERVLDLSNEGAVASFIDEIWPVIQKGNERIDQHGKIAKGMVVVACSSSRPLSRTSKGSLARKEIFEAFDAEIEAAYLQSESDVADILPDLNDAKAVQDHIRQGLSRSVDWKFDEALLSNEDDLFETGMDSRQAMILRSFLRASARKTNNDKVVALMTKEFIYSNPTIASMQQALTGATDNEAGTAADRRDARLGAMLAAVRNHCKVFENLQIDNRPDALGFVGKAVILTGSTGNLGSNILYSLATDPTVCSIFCLNRKSADSETNGENLHARQVKANQKGGITVPENAWAKIHLLEVDNRQSDMGLDGETYKQLACASHIIHNAWPMDFNRSLVSFEVQFKALDNIIRLALNTRAATAPRILFTSSIATVARYGVQYNEGAVPEIPIDDPEVSAHFGYSEAKWVCEQILHKVGAMSAGKIEPIIVRVGQLTGSTTAGVWSPAEHLPSIFKSSQTLKALPDLSGTLSWIPVDVAAHVVTELIFQTPPPKPTSPVYHLENPNRQRWSDILTILKKSLSSTSPRGSETIQTIPFPQWLARVRTEEPDTAKNPARKVEGFLEEEFNALASGGVELETQKATAVSKTLATAPTVGEELMDRYVRYWKGSGFM